MNHEQKIKCEELSEYLSTYARKWITRTPDIEAQEADLIWDAARFWSKILIKCNQRKNIRTKAQFDSFVQKYNSSTRNIIDANALFAKYWLRKVVGRIHIASTIRQSLHTFNEIRQYCNELRFISQFYNARSKHQQLRVSRSSLDEAALKFEELNEVKLDTEGIYFKRWASVKDDDVELSAIDIYFDPFLQYWSEFDFLNEWEALSKAEPDVRFQVSKVEFENLREFFSHFCPIPDVSVLERNGTIISNADFFILNLTNKPGYWEALQDKIGGYYWQELCADESYDSDKLRLLKWLECNLHSNLWPDISKYTTSESKRRFLDAIFSILLEEEDILGSESELDRIELDTRTSRGAEMLSNTAIKLRIVENFDSGSLFGMYKSLRRIEDAQHSMSMHDQPSRHVLTFLIHAAVQCDEPKPLNSLIQRSEQGCFGYVITLLLEGKQRPFLTWSVSQAIVRRRPEIIPYLLTNLDCCTLSLCLIDEVELNKAAHLSYPLWVEATKLVVSNLALSNEQPDLIAVLIYQIFQQLNKDKYKINYNQVNLEREGEVERKRKERELAVLKEVEDARKENNSRYNGTNTYLLSEIYDQLVQCFGRHNDVNLLRNGTIHFPMLKWDGLFWLIKIGIHWKFKQLFSKTGVKLGELSEMFLKQYLETIELTEVSTYDYFKGAEEKSLPLWSEKIERLERLEWIYPIYGLYTEGKLSQFLAPRIDFVKSSDEFNEKNRFSVAKLRTHIGVLLQVLRKLVSPSMPFEFRKNSIQEIKRSIEGQILTYVRHFSKEIPSDGRHDLFSYNKEWQFNNNHKDTLLPKIGQAINWFSNKEDIIDAFISSGDIFKLLTLLDYIYADGIRSQLLKSVKATDIIKYLEAQHWIPAIESTLTKMSHFPELLAQTEQIVKYWEEKIVNRRQSVDHKVRLYISKLLLAYFKKDRIELESVELPGQYNGSGKELNYVDIKAFYRGLLLMEHSIEQSVKIFNDLAMRNPTHISILQNRLSAKMVLAEITKDEAHYREAYDQWKEAEKTFDAEQLEAAEPELSSNLLTILHRLGENKKADDLFSHLDLQLKMSPNILRVRVDSLAKSNRIGEAMLLVDLARTYHEFSGETSSFVEELESYISGEDNVEQLSVYYQMIFRSSPEKLVRVLPESFNGKRSLIEFLVREFANAGDKMLDKVRSIDKIKNEDKYNDIIELVLDSRLNILGLHVGAQGRGAYSASATNVKERQPGRRDLPILDINKKVVLVCESLIYRGKTTAERHVRKVFNYHHQRQAFLMLYFYTGLGKGTFDRDWEEYSQRIVPNINYPSEMNLTSAFDDVSKEFGCKFSAVKVGKSRHGVGTAIYHLFINVNYEVKV
jgi:hypothetical protein